MISQDQFVGLIRHLIPQIGAICTTLGFTAWAAGLDTYASVICLLAGPVFQAIGPIWSLFANSKSSIIKSATQMTEVNSKKFAASITDPTLKAVAQDVTIPNAP